VAIYTVNCYTILYYGNEKMSVTYNIWTDAEVIEWQVFLWHNQATNTAQTNTHYVAALLSALFCFFTATTNILYQPPPSVIGVSRPPVLDCGTTFHLDYGGRDLPSTPSDNL